MSYALAQVCGEELLFKGQDFAQTDIDSAVTPLAGAWLVGRECIALHVSLACSTDIAFAKEIE